MEQAPLTDKLKKMGIILDQHSSWKSLISEVSRKILAAVAPLRRLRNILSIPTKVALAQSLLIIMLNVVILI